MAAKKKQEEFKAQHPDYQYSRASTKKKPQTIEDVGDRCRADLRADLLVQRLAELLVQLDEGIRTAALPSVRLELLAGLSDVAVIEHDRGRLHAVLAEVALQQSSHGSDPAFTAILDHIVNWGLGGIRTLHESQRTR